MARQPRLEFPHAVYHVSSHGNAGYPIAGDEHDGAMFLSVLGSVVERYNWLCHAYCLMDDHYHLMIETPDANLSRGMRQLNGVYTQKHNRRHGRSGHIFEGRYKAVVVEKETYLLELCRYVVLNPLRSRLAVMPGGWAWSSYRATTGEAGIPAWIYPDRILGSFSSKWSHAREAYKKYVLDGIYQESPWPYLKGRIFLGTDAFIKNLKPLLKNKERMQEVPGCKRHVSRPQMSKLFKAGETKAIRDWNVYIAHVKYGYTLKEIADHLKIHYTTVSKALAGFGS